MRGGAGDDSVPAGPGVSESAGDRCTVPHERDLGRRQGDRRNPEQASSLPSLLDHEHQWAGAHRFRSGRRRLPGVVRGADARVLEPFQERERRRAVPEQPDAVRQPGPGVRRGDDVRLPGTSADPVALTVSGCPAETTCAFTPATGVARFDSTFRVNTTPASPLGNFDLTITATNASASTTVPFHLTIADRASLTFRRGDGTAFGETDDLYIYSGATTTNYGTALKLLVDGLDCIAAGTVCKTLIKFPSIVGPNPGQIPAGSRIVDATLSMTIRNKGQTDDAYQITEAWDEASASWNSFAVHGVPGNRGKEFTFTPDHFGRFPVNITSIAQRWSNGEANDGMLLASTHWDGVDYNSSETVRDRPSLTVQFVPPRQPLLLAYDMETLTPNGRMEDRSGTGKHGTMTGTADVSGKIGRARQFNPGDRITTVPIQ